VVAVSTEGAIPTDLNRLRIVVERGGRSPSLEPYDLPVGAPLPGTITLKPLKDGEVEGVVKISVEGFLKTPSGEEKKRVLRTARVGFVAEKQKLLRMPLRFSCFDTDDCPEGKTCLGGECVSDSKEAASLPDYEERLVVVSGAGCFDERTCLSAGTLQSVTLAPGSCSFDAPGPAGSFNLAMEWAVAPGSAVLLEQDPQEGFTLDAGKITLAPGLCKALESKRALGLFASQKCAAKAPDQPVCKVEPGPLPQNVGPGAWVVDGPGGTQISGPPGALNDLSGLKIEEDPSGAPPLPQGYEARSKTFAFLPHGQTFAQAVTIRVPYSGVVQSAPVLLTAPAQGTSWEVVPGAQDTSTAMTADVTHFSYFVVAEAAGGSGAGGSAGQGGDGGAGGNAGVGGDAGSAGDSGSAGDGGASGQGGGGGCSHDLCTPGAPLDPTCDSCAEKICESSSGCCTETWGSDCVELVPELCLISCEGPGGAGGEGGAAGDGGTGAGGGGSGGESGSSSCGEVGESFKWCNSFDPCSSTAGLPSLACKSGVETDICSFAFYQKCCQTGWDGDCAGLAAESFGTCSKASEKAEFVTESTGQSTGPMALDLAGNLHLAGYFFYKHVPGCSDRLFSLNSEKISDSPRGVLFDVSEGRFLWFSFLGKLWWMNESNSWTPTLLLDPGQDSIKSFAYLGSGLLLGLKDSTGGWRLKTCEFPGCQNPMGTLLPVGVAAEQLAVMDGWVYMATGAPGAEGQLRSCPFGWEAGCTNPPGVADPAYREILAMTTLKGKLYLAVRESGFSGILGCDCNVGTCACAMQVVSLAGDSPGEVDALAADEAQGHLYYRATSNKASRIYRVNVNLTKSEDCSGDRNTGSRDPMEASYWLARWQEGRIGFHEVEGNDLLRKYLERLTGGETTSVLVPLCGKAVDLRVLAAAGHEVRGVELAPLAAEAFFQESGVEPERDTLGPFERLRADNLTYLLGDVFALTPELLGTVGAIFDRAALVALEPFTRERYAGVLSSCLAPGGRILLVTFEYDQALAPGPPFSVPREEVQRLFGERFELTLLEERPVEAQNPRLREQGVTSIQESAWLLSDRIRR
jgi:thiopurine S-methyltransferase